MFNSNPTLIYVDRLGIQNATQFIVLLERGKGDSVKEIAECWGDADIEEIHNRVMEWKAKRQQMEDELKRCPSVSGVDQVLRWAREGALGKVGCREKKA